LMTVCFICTINAQVNQNTTQNIWLKTYQNYKNYNIIVNNIAKAENKIQKNEKNLLLVGELNKKISIYKSKLKLYENNNLDNILRQYKYEVPNISLKDFIVRSSQNNLDKLIQKYIVLKNNFYLARSSFQNTYNLQIKETNNTLKIASIKDDLEYFNEYVENIEKTYQNLLDARDDLEKKYQEYQDEILTKHIMTIVIIIISYTLYKILSLLIFHFTHNKENHQEQKNYKKLLSLLFIFFIILFIFIRYIDDLIYIITFLSVVAAALTIAMREVLLNIAGAIYVFFTSLIKVGDRVMVQFETKHTIGDIVDISLIKIKLNEVEDYTNIKEVKTVGRTIYIPNSYIFTKVFYNYSLKKNGTINDLIEFEFNVNSDFKSIEQVTSEIFSTLNIQYTINFNLNTLKTGIIGLISYQTNYKDVAKNRGELSIKLLEKYHANESIKLKTSKSTNAKINDEE